MKMKLKTKISILSSCIALVMSSQVFASQGTSQIDNGDLVPTFALSSAPYNAVVKILINLGDGTSACTGSLIRYNAVITAGHCVFKDAKGQQKITPDSFTITSADGTHQYHATHVYSDYNGTYHDFAVLALDNTDQSVATAPVAALQSSGTHPIYKKDVIKNQQPLLSTGYGINLPYQNAYEHQPTARDKDIGRGLIDRDGWMAYDRSENTNDVFNKGVLLKGEQTPTSDSNTIKTLVASGLSDASGYPESQFFSTCSTQSTDHGDSGGPVFYDDNGQYTLIGVTSRGLTIPYQGRYYSYTKCMDYTGTLQSGTRISEYTDLTTASDNRILLDNYLKEIPS
ncbi:trypsin-like serine protease [Dongshaea marina]|uniref:trypsin-like serine protease n=1 Tax=Dongshaea marina TaxID=2047966 RepID=UPI000D3EA422|nr:trypsin-like serine protease [Dongshaea marina]